jgi:serine/threonine protein kinase
MTGKLEDYNVSITVPALIKDPALNRGKCVMNGNGTLRRYAGGFCVVYPFVVDRRQYAVRCWYNEVENARFRAEKVSEILKTVNLPYFVGFEYVERGIFASGEIRPIVRMEWVEGDELKDYICKHKKDSLALYRLADKFLRMAVILHSHSISHGDLQHGNIKVKDDGSIVLVDYDSLYHPSMGRLADCILGRSEYQHPLRGSNRNASEHVDYFSEIVIYTSLLYFAANPDAYTDEIHGSEGLIFAPRDYLPANIATSRGYGDLCRYSNETRFLAGKIAEICRDARSLETIPRLETILTEGIQNGLNFDCVQISDIVEEEKRRKKMEERMRILIAGRWKIKQQEYGRKRIELAARRCELAARQRKTEMAIRRSKKWIVAAVITLFILSAGEYTFNRYREAKQSYWQTCMQTGNDQFQRGNYAEALASYRTALSVPLMMSRQKTVKLNILTVRMVIYIKIALLQYELPLLLDAYKVLESQNPGSIQLQYLETEITRRISQIREMQPDNREINNPKYKPFI